MVDIKHLRLLRAIADLGTLSAAARELGYSQPAVSQQLNNLERELRTAVVLRVPGGTRLTEAGEILLRHGASVLASLSLAETEIEGIRNLQAGRIRIVGFPSATATIISSALGHIKRQLPGVEFSLVSEVDPLQALERLRSGACELAVVYEHFVPSEPAAGLDLKDWEVQVELAVESFTIAFPTSHPQATTRTINVASLADDRWVAGNISAKSNIEKVCKRAGFEPKIAFETDDYVALQSLVAANLALALVPEMQLATTAPRDGVTFQPIPSLLQRRSSIVTTRQLLRVPGVSMTIRALQESTRELRERIGVPSVTE
jgi:molybdate transport repressor ModE-like protein